MANLILQNVGGGNSGGISAQGLGGSQLSVTISHCVVRGFNWGISMAGPGINVMIADTIVTNNTQVGISVTFGGAILDHVTVKQSINGIIIGHGGVTLIDSLVANNSFSGVLIESSSLTIAHSTVTGNKYGLNTIPTVGHINSFGDNHVYGNGTDVVEGTLTNVGTK